MDCIKSASAIKTKLMQDIFIPDELKQFNIRTVLHPYNCFADSREVDIMSTVAIVRELQQFKSSISAELHTIHSSLSPSTESLYTELQEIQKAIIILNPTYEAKIQKSISQHLQLEEKITNENICKEIVKIHIKKWKEILNSLIRIELDKDTESEDIL